MAKLCNNRGYCVAPDDWLPSETFDYHWVPMAPIIGCNRLRCTRCGAEVHHVAAGRAPAGVLPDELHRRIAQGPPLPSDPSGLGRLYACLCYTTVVFSSLQANRPDADPTMDEMTPWICDGHPPLTLPATLDGVQLDEHTNWAKLVGEVLGGRRVIRLHPAVDEVAGFWISRLYRLLGDRAGDAIGQAVASSLLSATALERLGAIRFFELNWRAPGVEHLAEAMRDRPELFNDVPDPIHPGNTLRTWMLKALSWRLGADALGPIHDDVALEVLRREATHAPGIGQNLYALASDDSGWSFDHAEELLRAAPKEWQRVLNVIKNAPPDRLAALARVVVGEKLATAAELRDFAASSFDELRSAAVARALSSGA